MIFTRGAFRILSNHSRKKRKDFFPFLMTMVKYISRSILGQIVTRLQAVNYYLPPSKVFVRVLNAVVDAI